MLQRPVPLRNNLPFCIGYGSQVTDRHDSRYYSLLIDAGRIRENLLLRIEHHTEWRCREKWIHRSGRMTV